MGLWSAHTHSSVHSPLWPHYRPCLPAGLTSGLLSYQASTKWSLISEVRLRGSGWHVTGLMLETSYTQDTCCIWDPSIVSHYTAAQYPALCAVFKGWRGGETGVKDCQVNLSQHLAQDRTQSRPLEGRGAGIPLLMQGYRCHHVRMHCHIPAFTLSAHCPYPLCAQAPTLLSH